jgi:cytochrome b subunit of formate dehydrogenase
MEAKSLKSIPTEAAPPAAAAEAQPSAKGAFVRRFGLFDRATHFFLMLSFLGLAGTGLPLLFSEERWAWWLSRLWGGYAAAAALHRFFGLVLILTFGSHVGRLFYRVAVKREKGILWGPTSMVPQLRDLKEMFAHMRYFLGLGERPRFDRYTYWEKFDYWAVFWGMFIIGGSGVVLWFPTVAALILPGWMLNIAEVIHGEEALLAVGFIFTVHFFNGHLRQGKFPMDLVIFTGRMSRHEMEEERQDELVRLGEAGKLPALEAPAPTPELLLVSRIIGGVSIVFGLALVVLILYAVVF